MTLSSRTRAELALIGVTIIWGSTFVMVKAALEEISTILFLTLRFTLAAALLAVIYRRRLNRAGLAPAAGAGALLFAAYVLQTMGLERTTPSKSAFLTGLCIPMVPLAGSLVYRVVPRMAEAAGILVATIGMALMTLPEGSWNLNRGDLLTTGCALAFALHMVVVARYAPVVGFETVAVAQAVTAALLGLVSVGWMEPVRFHPSPGAATAVAVTGLLATALAFTTMAWAQKYTTSTRSALIFALEPVVAWVTSWALTGETLALRARFGAVLILAGVLLVEFRPGASATKPVAATSEV